MRISPISANYGLNNQKRIQCVKQSQPNFEGKHTFAKFFGATAGTLGTLGALGGIAIMTGGISLIPTLAYGALCTGIGATFGHMIDKDDDSNKKK